MLLYVYNKQLQFVDSINAYIYSDYIKEFNGSGSFEVQIPFSKSIRRIKDLGYFIFFNKTVVGIILRREFSVDETTNNPIFILKGYLMNHILSRRCIRFTTTFLEKTRTEIVTSLVANNASQNASEENRRFPIIPRGVVIPPEYEDQILIDEQIAKTQITGGSIQEAVEKLLDIEGEGYEIIPNYTNGIFNKTFDFRIIIGIDRTVDNTYGNTPVVFSTNLKNIMTREYAYDITDFRNVAYVAGEGEGVNRTITQVGPENAIGLDRYELYVDARDLQRNSAVPEESNEEIVINSDSSSNTEEDIVIEDEDTEIEILPEDEEEEEIIIDPSEEEEIIVIEDEDYVKLLEERGVKKLKECKAQETYAITINQESQSYVYGVDYRLGDLVTVNDEDLGISLSARVTQVEEVSLGEKSIFNITLGYYRFSTSQKLKRNGVI